MGADCSQRGPGAVVQGDFSGVQRRGPDLCPSSSSGSVHRTASLAQCSLLLGASSCLRHGAITVTPRLWLRKRRPRADHLGQDPQAGRGRASHEPSNAQVRRAVPRAPQLQSYEHRRSLDLADGAALYTAAFLPQASPRLSQEISSKIKKHPRRD